MALGAHFFLALTGSPSTVDLPIVFYSWLTTDPPINATPVEILSFRLVLLFGGKSDTLLNSKSLAI